MGAGSGAVRQANCGPAQEHSIRPGARPARAHRGEIGWDQDRRASYDLTHAGL
jgi:hypothetical protein